MPLSSVYTGCITCVCLHNRRSDVSNNQYSAYFVTYCYGKWLVLYFMETVGRVLRVTRRRKWPNDSSEVDRHAHTGQRESLHFHSRSSVWGMRCGLGSGLAVSLRGALTLMENFKVGLGWALNYVNSFRIFSASSRDLLRGAIHSGYFYRASSSPLLLRGAPDYSIDTGFRDVLW